MWAAQWQDLSSDDIKAWTLLAIVASVLGYLVSPVVAVVGTAALPVLPYVAVAFVTAVIVSPVKVANTLFSVRCAVLHAVVRLAHPFLTAVFQKVSPCAAPSPQLRALGALVKLTRQPGRELTLEKFRETCRGFAILFWHNKPIHRDTIMVKASGPDREVLCHFLRTAMEPEHAPPLLFYLHGGGFVAGDAGSYRGMIAPVAKRLNCNVFAVEYRKMPEHVLPAAVDDAVAAYRYLTVTQGLDPRNIVFAGDSAGGALCLLTLFAIRRDPELRMCAGAMLMSPYVDMTLSTASWERNKGKCFLLEPRVIDTAKKLLSAENIAATGLSRDLLVKHSPAFYEHTEFVGLPPLFVSRSLHEPLTDEIGTFAEKAKQAGVDIHLEEEPHTPHVYQMFYMYCPEGKVAMDKGIAFLKNCLRRGDPERSPASAAASSPDASPKTRQSVEPARGQNGHHANGNGNGSGNGAPKQNGHGSDGLYTGWTSFM